MSARGTGVASTQYMTVGGTQVPLPPGARVDLAYQTDLTPQNNGFGNSFYNNTTGDYLILLSFTLLFRANAVAGTRTFYAAMYPFVGSNTANAVWLMPTGVAVTENVYVEASYMAGLAASYSATSTDFSGAVRVYAGVPLPPAVMLPGYAVYASGAGPSVDSVVSASTILAIRVPSGPNDAAAAAPPPFTAPALV